MRKLLAVFSMAAFVAFAGCADTSTISAPDGGVNLASVKLKGGANAKPSFTDNGLTLSTTASLSGLGNGDVFVGLSALANATATCGNPGTNQHQPAGQNPAPVQVTGGLAVPQEEIKNGNLTFTVSTLVPAGAGPRSATRDECPGTNWTYTITDLAFTSAIITVYQPSTGDPENPGTLVLRVSCTFTPATSNGAVSGGTVSCTQQQL